MKISEMNWQQLENWLQKDDRAILPLGSTEQHAFLSLSVDSILAEKSLKMLPPTPEFRYFRFCHLV